MDPADADANLTVSTTSAEFVLTNSGDLAGAEIAQLYLTYPTSAGEPPGQLRGFRKVTLDPRQEVAVTIPLSPRSFEVWDEEVGGWVGVKGAFELSVGASSCDLRASATLTV